ncbi:PEGA domain-containing protein [Hyalangium gracile]|uniref:PEGA domain-containing protein n=1 Tax=Hyalangium gracile TaxID=394092 RepID=UPI001CCF8B71|nr:PEGA domain-containing protein [Hyalangium gracile]
MRRTWNRVVDAALSGLLVGLLAAGPALAQQPALRLLPRVLPSAAAPKLIVLVVPLDAPAQAQVPRLTYQAEQLLAAEGRFELLRLSDALDARGAQEREAKAREAAEALKEGLKAYDELDTQRALQQFDKAAQSYEGSDLSRHFPELSRARVMKIASFVANGDNKGFVRELREMLPRNPRAEFSSNYFPPDELAVIERMRKGVLADANRTLEVKTGEVPAQVFVDGQFQGFSPVALSGLTPAEHFVTVIAPGYALAQGKVRGEASFTLEPLPSGDRLKALVARIASNPDGLDRDAALREVGTLTQAQQVVALMVRGSPGVAPQNATAVRVDVSDGHNLAYATAAVPLSEAGKELEAEAQALLTGVLQADAPRVRGKPSHLPALPSTGSGRKTAGYVLLGTGAALVAGGVFFGLQASSKANEFKDAPQSSSEAEQLRSDGKTFALIADIGLIAGLASAGTGAWLAFAGGDDDGKAEARPNRPTPTPAPRREPTPAPRREPATEPRPADKPATEPAPTPAPSGKPAANAREEEKRKREEEERRKREEEERLKREEDGKKKRGEEERLKREEEERRKREEAERLEREEEERKKREEASKREQEERRKREEEERKKREEEEKKKRPPLDEDDLRNY